MKRNYIENDKDLTIFTIDNFISDEDCNYLCDFIRKNNYRSTVTGKGSQYSITMDGRTSSSSTLENNNPIVKKIDKNIVNELEVPIENGETLQGQLYKVSQEFKHHHDYFSEDGYINHCLASGQRTWTCMAYLNNVEEGGETDFPEINAKFKPKKGMAIFWSHFDSNGKENPASLHAGLPVIEGEKIIITKWLREKKYDGNEDTRLGNEYWKKLEEPNEKTFSTSSDLPKLTSLGFKVVKVPTNTWRLIQEAYKLLQNVKTVETWDGMEKFIHDADGNKMDLEIFNMDNCFRIKEIIQEELLPVHQEFIENKESIKPLWIYGIRSYKRGAVLEPHTDTLGTHHISSIIIVDKQVDRDWPLDIQDHQGRWHKIYAEPGDMILYESATCKHGRLEPFEGEYFRNFYLHYTLSDYKFKP
jgi:prolyl 4-hydroxylase